MLNRHHIVMILDVVKFVRQKIETVYDIYWNGFNLKTSNNQSGN